MDSIQSSPFSSANFEQPSEEINFASLPPEVLAKIFGLAQSNLASIALTTTTMSDSIDCSLKYENITVNKASGLVTIEAMKSFVKTHAANISKLDLSTYINISENDIKEIISLTSNLEELDLSDKLITGNCFQGVNLPNLKNLNLSSCINLTDENLKSLLLTTPKIESLNIGYTKLAGTFLIDIDLDNVLPELISLETEGCDTITEEAFVIIMEKFQYDLV